MYYNYYQGQYDYAQRQMGMDMGQGMGMGLGNLSSDAHLINDISKAIIGEVHVYNFYEKFSALVKNEQD